MWVSTHNGIFVLDTETLHLRQFGVTSGLIGDEFNSRAFANIDEAIIETIITLAENLGMSCIAEGADTKEQVDFLVSRKCHLIQGYFYCKTLAIFDILSMIEENSDAYRSII